MVSTLRPPTRVRATNSHPEGKGGATSSLTCLAAVPRDQPIERAGCWLGASTSAALRVDGQRTFQPRSTRDRWACGRCPERRGCPACGWGPAGPGGWGVGPCEPGLSGLWLVPCEPGLSGLWLVPCEPGLSGLWLVPCEPGLSGLW